MNTIYENWETTRLGVSKSRTQIISILDTLITQFKDTQDQIRPFLHANKTPIQNNKPQSSSDLDLQTIQMQDDQEEEPSQEYSQLKMLTVINTLTTKIDKLDPLKRVIRLNVDYFNHLSKFGKVISKNMITNIEAATTPTCFDESLVNQAIAEHLYQTGNFKIAEMFCREANINISQSFKSQFYSLFEILNDLREKKLDQAILWVNKNKKKLDKIGSDLAFTVHKLKYISLVKKAKMAQNNRSAQMIECIKFTKEALHQFKSNPKYQKSIEELITSLLFIDNLDESPYANIYTESYWNFQIQNFIKSYCCLLGLCKQSHLYLATKAGTYMLPKLLKVADIMKGKEELMSKKELPIETELGKEFQFHSIFICPVSKEISSRDNPPMLLTCGHVIAKNSMEKMHREFSRNKIKCPTCPKEQNANQAKEIILFY